MALSLPAGLTSAAAFPADDGLWIPLTQGGITLGDPATDGANNGREIVGDDTHPAIYTYSDSTDFFVRLRIDETPVQGADTNDLKPYGWGVLIILPDRLDNVDASGTIIDYEYSLIVNGITDTIDLYQNTTKTGLGDPSDLAETLEIDPPYDWDTTEPGGNGRVLLADSAFAGTDDYFLDFSIPLVAMEGAGVTADTEMILVGGTSNNGRSISLDIAGSDQSPGPGILDAAASDPVYGDGTPVVLEDSDGDGINDDVEIEMGTDPGIADTDGDGVPDGAEDSDGDGITNLEETNGGTAMVDTDGDGTPDVFDDDSDGDGVLDATEGTVDTDGDGLADYVDPDDDNDGILTRVEATPVDPDVGEESDGLLHGDDVDGDGVPNYLDTDSDNDGISDDIEGREDTDGDGIPNYFDTDSDNDGIDDVVEGETDTDNDGIPDYLDPTSDLTDGDNDGITDGFDNCPEVMNEAQADEDNDGLGDICDSDVDGDGLDDDLIAGGAGIPINCSAAGQPALAWLALLGACVWLRRRRGSNPEQRSAGPGPIPAQAVEHGRDDDHVEQAAAQPPQTAVEEPGRLDAGQGDPGRAQQAKAQRVHGQLGVEQPPGEGGSGVGSNEQIWILRAQQHGQRQQPGGEIDPDAEAPGGRLAHALEAARRDVDQAPHRRASDQRGDQHVEDPVHHQGGEALGHQRAQRGDHQQQPRPKRQQQRGGRLPPGGDHPEQQAPGKVEPGESPGAGSAGRRGDGVEVKGDRHEVERQQDHQSPETAKQPHALALPLALEPANPACPVS